MIEGRKQGIFIFQHYGFPDLPLSYFLLYPFTLLHQDTNPHVSCIPIVRTFEAFILALTIIPLFFLAKNYLEDKDSIFLTTLLITFPTTAIPLVRSTGLKNIVGNLFLVFTIYFLTKREEWAVSDIIIGTFLFSLTFLSHQLSFLYLLEFTLLFIVGDIIANKRLEKKKLLVLTIFVTIWITITFMVTWYSNPLWRYKKIQSVFFGEMWGVNNSEMRQLSTLRGFIPFVIFLMPFIQHKLWKKEILNNKNSLLLIFSIIGILSHILALFLADDVSSRLRGQTYLFYPFVVGILHESNPKQKWLLEIVTVFLIILFILELFI